MIQTEKNPDSHNVRMRRALIALSVTGTFMLLGWLLKFSAYGIDFTDEGFYLVWISNPSIYSGSITQFGFVYHPLYSFVGGDIAALRRANILITYGLAWCLTYFFLASLAPAIKESRASLLTVSAGLATSAFILFDSWLPTPSYNSLALQALLVTAIGLVLAKIEVNCRSIFGWVCIGVGGWLAFMAKPSTAFALAIGVLIHLLLSRRLSIRMIALAATSALALLLASALLIDGSVSSFVERIRSGLQFSAHLGGGYTLEQIVRIDAFQVDPRMKTAILLVFGTLLIALWSMWVKNRQLPFIGLLISIAFFACTAALTLGQIHQAAGLGEFQALLIFAVICPAVLAGVALGRFRALATISATQWALAGLFLVMPHIYAFGTNGNYWRTGGAAAIFWLLAGMIHIGPLVRERASWMLVLPIALATQAVTGTLLQTGIEHPYRQPQSLRLNSATLEIGPRKSALVLSDGYARYIANAATATQGAGFEPHTPVIDLSGQSPGILYALGAESIGQAWTIGGYPGSLRLAEATLARVSCEKIAKAWVLIEPDGPRSIPPELMPVLGMKFPSDYEQVARWQTAEGAGGYAAPRTQELYKPARPMETLLSCQALRAKGIQ